jgi:hypothetical protein
MWPAYETEFETPGLYYLSAYTVRSLRPILLDL